MRYLPKLLLLTVADKPTPNPNPSPSPSPNPNPNPNPNPLTRRHVGEDTVLVAAVTEADRLEARG